MGTPAGVARAQPKREALYFTNLFRSMRRKVGAETGEGY
jgi:hypothetical protein